MGVINSNIEMKGPEYISDYLDKYRGYLGDNHPFTVPPEHLLQKYRAELVPQEVNGRKRRKSYVRLHYIGEDASTASYVVGLGIFKFTITVLNLQKRSPSGVEMGSGSFG